MKALQKNFVRSPIESEESNPSWKVKLNQPGSNFSSKLETPKDGESSVLSNSSLGSSRIGSGRVSFTFASEEMAPLKPLQTAASKDFVKNFAESIKIIIEFTKEELNFDEKRS
jgi:hypothetical protein